MCAYVQVCMCDWEYFMVEQRVNSDRRQMWSHPSKAARLLLFQQDHGIRPKQHISQDDILPCCT